MKQKLLIALTLLLALNLRAALIEFDSSGKETDIGAHNKNMFSFKGLVVYDNVSSNMTFVEWETSSKTYHTYTITNFSYTTIIGIDQDLVISEASSGTDTNGYNHLDSRVLTGSIETVNIANKLNVRFPKKLEGSNNSSLGPDESGNEWLATWDETLQFDSKRTKEDNKAGLPVDQVVSAFIVTLQEKGYTAN